MSEKADEEGLFLSNELKEILDERRLNAKEEDFTDWDIAKKKLTFKW